MSRHLITIALAMTACCTIAEPVSAQRVSAQRVSARRAPKEFVSNFCADCHSGSDAEMEVRLDDWNRDWHDHETVAFWRRVVEAVRAGRMPPEDAEQPSPKARQAFLKTVHRWQSAKSPVGGTVLRRLNRTEYENTVRSLFGINFRTPNSFPADTSAHGFDNIGESLVLSPPLMQQYLEVAASVADQIIPPPTLATTIESETIKLRAQDFSVNFEGSKVHGSGDAATMRLVTKNEVMVRSSTWPTRFDARHSGRYHVTVRAGAFKPASNEELSLSVLARRSTGNLFSTIGSLRKLGEFQIDPREETQSFQLDTELFKGETLVFYWANAPFGWDRADKAEAARQLRERLRDPKVYAAWLKMGFQRGNTPAEDWAQMKQLIASGNLELNDPRLQKLPERFPATSQNQLMWLFEQAAHELGPGLEIHGVAIHGPTELIEEEEDRAAARRKAEFLGERPGDADDRSHAATILRRFLPQAFRKPVGDRTLGKYVRLVTDHIDAGRTFEEGIHLAIRAALCSPDFLYREQASGGLTDHDLASRLSYFLTAHPPDEKLIGLADRGKLSDPKTLTREAKRLIASGKSQYFIESFTGQWLGIRRLRDIMPDPRLLKFSDRDRQAMIAETEMFFAEVLRENYPVNTFIDPDFSYVNHQLNKSIYKIPDLDLDETPQRVALPPGGRQGGILCLASVMMATANGVDTQPVLRGVWLLENVFGDPPPTPPQNVPAIEPDTSGAKTIRELLLRHQADAVCASCHRKIDPPGFALENFDPVGRWRDHYPVFNTKKGKVVRRDGHQVDATGVMPDGTKLRDVTDLKKYLTAEGNDQFARCLTEKLLTYATGRPLSYGDRQIAVQIVQELNESKGGFQDLIIAVVLSDSFRVK